MADALFASERARIAKLAISQRLPTIFPLREHVEAGGLLSYGIDALASYERAAYYVDRILKGTKADDLPIEFPTKLVLTINLKTAKALNLTIPPTLIALADEIIE